MHNIRKRNQYQEGGGSVNKKDKAELNYVVVSMDSYFGASVVE